MQSAVSADSPSSSSQKTVDATRHARAFSPFSSSSLKTGTNAADERRVGHERAHEVRHLERDREGVDLALDAEVAARDDLADEAEDAREAGRDAEDRRRGREVAPADDGIGVVHARDRIWSGPAFSTPLVPSIRPRSGSFSVYAEHSPAEEACPDGRAPARRERPLPLDRAHAHAQARTPRWKRATRTPSRPRTAISCAGSTAPSRAARSTGTPLRAASRRRHASSLPASG